MKRRYENMMLVFLVTFCCVLVNIQIDNDQPWIGRIAKSCTGNQDSDDSQETTQNLSILQPLHSNSVDSRSSENDPLTLSYGDLPGYTGWARPVHTTAPWYRVEVPSTTTVGVESIWTIQCRVPACRNFNALFDVRAYGPAIVPGHVVHHEQHSGHYNVSFFFQDAGIYVVEIVLAFSHVLPLSRFPTKTEPKYEGYLLPGMPTTVLVNHNTSYKTSPSTLHIRRQCKKSDLVETNSTSALDKGRWKVIERTQSTGKIPDPHMDTSFVDYKYGSSSIGFKADYLYKDCDLADVPSLVSQSTKLNDRSKHTIVFIGDSHMRKQHKIFVQHFADLFPSVYLKTNDGLLTRFPEISQGLDTLKREQNNTGGKIHIIFNAGLHEIAILCSQRRVQSRGRVIPTPDKAFSCTEQYRLNLRTLISLVVNIPTASLVFQSTSAGWLKWGNYGFVWEPNRTQEFPSDAHACADFNDIAFDLMDIYNIPVIDSYWMTLARPDHREIDEINSRGKKMVHAGVEVYDVLLRKWLSVVLEDGLADSI